VASLVVVTTKKNQVVMTNFVSALTSTSTLRFN